jgi:hypothetical protein
MHTTVDVQLEALAMCISSLLSPELQHVACELLMLLLFLLAALFAGMQRQLMPVACQPNPAAVAQRSQH